MTKPRSPYIAAFSEPASPRDIRHTREFLIALAILALYILVYIWSR